VSAVITTPSRFSSTNRSKRATMRLTIARAWTRPGHHNQLSSHEFATAQVGKFEQLFGVRIE